MKSLTAALAIVMALCLCGTALARPIEQAAAPWTAAPVDTQVVGDDHWKTTVAPAAPVVGDDHWKATVAPEAVTPLLDAALPSPGGGLSAFVIVLIAAGGALTLAGAAYMTVRVVHRHGHAVS
jgi:hypothetical protein